MKVNFKKIDTARAVELLTAHAEKIVFGVFVLAFLLFCYGAIRQQPYDKTPDRFTTKANEVRQTVENAVFDRATDVPSVPKAPESKEIAANVWVTRDAWVQPVFDTGQRRPEPRLLAARDLRVASGYGAVATISVTPAEGTAPARGVVAAPTGVPAMPPTKGGGMKMNMMQAAKAGGAKAGGFGDDAPAHLAQPPAGYSVTGQPKGKQWVVVTALVPLQEQIKDYRAAFQGTYKSSDPLRDQQPDYVGYEAERAEVQPGTAEDAELKWAPVDRKSIEADEAAYAGAIPDMIDPMYYAGQACRPLPPLMGKVHDKTVVHPKIPLAASGADTAAMPGAVGPGAAGPVLAAAPQPVATPVAPRGMRMGGMGHLGAGPAFESKAQGMTTGQAAATAAPKIEYQMFRFFDFTVRPGKSYRYRVRLLVANPNHGIPARYLAQAALAQGETRPTAWSEPSPIVTASRGSSMLAGGVDPQKGLNEQNAHLLVRAWNPSRAVDAVRISKLVRGQVANFNDKVPVRTPDTGAVTTEQIKFETDALLVDMAGGDAFTGTARAPGQMLVLEPNGELTVRSELAEAETYGPALKDAQAMTDVSKPQSGGEERGTAGGRGIDKLQPPGKDSKPRGLPLK